MSVLMVCSHSSTRKLTATSVGQDPTPSLGLGPEGFVLSIYWLDSVVSLITYYAIMIGIAQAASEDAYLEDVDGKISFMEAPYKITIIPNRDAMPRKLQYQHILYGIFITSERMYQRREYQEVIADLLIDEDNVGQMSFRKVARPRIGADAAPPMLNSTTDLDVTNENVTSIKSLTDDGYTFFTADYIPSKYKMNAEVLFLLTLRTITILGPFPADAVVSEGFDSGNDTKVSIALELEPPDPRTTERIKYRDVTYALAKIVLEAISKGFWEREVTWLDINKPGGRIKLATMRLTVRSNMAATSTKAISTS